MENIIFKLIKKHFKCTHKNALRYTNEGYCPDCGAYLKKNYYIVRCARCDIKKQAHIVFGDIEPDETFCSNCGSREYYIEKIDKVNFVDASFAIYLKEPANPMEAHADTQIWVEENEKIKQITEKEHADI